MAESVLNESSTKCHELLFVSINDKWNGRLVFGVMV